MAAAAHWNGKSTITGGAMVGQWWAILGNMLVPNSCHSWQLYQLQDSRFVMLLMMILIMMRMMVASVLLIMIMINDHEDADVKHT